MQKAMEYAAVYAVGGVGYTLVEMLWRGYSHWTMALTGGACLALIYMVNGKFGEAPLWKRCLAGSLIITQLELSVGFVVNMLLSWDVWDYSDMIFNLFGQICPIYSVLWFLLCIPVIGLCGVLRRGFDRIFAKIGEVRRVKS